MAQATNEQRTPTEVITAKNTKRGSTFTFSGAEYNRSSNEEMYMAVKGTIALNLSAPTTTQDFSVTASSILTALGCSISDESFDHSLLSTQTDVEIIANANIVDMKSFEKATNSLIPTLTPPGAVFAELDSSPPENVERATTKIAKAKEVSTLKLTSDIPFIASAAEYVAF
jgi:hypothetical protein